VRDECWSHDSVYTVVVLVIRISVLVMRKCVSSLEITHDCYLEL